MAGPRTEEIFGPNDPEKERQMSLKEQLRMDLDVYGVNYVYEIGGKQYRLDPRFVRKTELREKKTIK